MGKGLVKITIGLIALIFANASASAHEFWIEAAKPDAAAGTVISAHVRVGQDFKGEAQYYLTSDIKKAGVIDSQSDTPLKRRIGDFPVFLHQPVRTGMHILYYSATPGYVKYTEAGKFEKYLRKEGLERILGEHAARKLPATGFSESFVRYAKALVQRGAVSNGDREIGFRHELVAQKNPYALKGSGELSVPVKVLWEGKLLKNARVFIFEKAAGDATKTHLQSDENGIVNVPVKTGYTYMLNTVNITPEDASSGAVWQSHWASLTFAIGPATSN